MRPNLIADRTARVTKETLSFLAEPRTNQDMQFKFNITKSNATKRLMALRSKGLADYHREGNNWLWQAV